MNQSDTKKSKHMGLIQWAALVMLVAAMFSASKRAALPAIFAVVRFAWPFILIWVIWRFIKGKVSAVTSKFQEQVMQAAGQHPAGGASGQSSASGGFRDAIRNAARQSKNDNVIDLCPKCGSLLAKGHLCEKT